MVRRARCGEGNLLWALGSVAYFTADAAEAEDWYRRSLELHRAAGDRSMEAWSLHMLALALAGQRRWEEAQETGRHAIQHFHEAGDIAGVTLVIDDLSIVALGLGDADTAGMLWGAARQLQERTGTALADYVHQNFQLFGVPTPKDVTDPAKLEALADAGAALSLDELVGLALGTETTEARRPHREEDA